MDLNSLLMILDLPLYCAYDVSRFEHEHKRDEIAQQYAGQKYVRNFPASGLHDRCMIVFDKHGNH